MKEEQQTWPGEEETENSEVRESSGFHGCCHQNGIPFSETGSYYGNL